MLVTTHGERYGGRNSVGNGTKRLQNGSIHAVFPLFCPRNPSSLITGRFFLENDSRWLVEKRHVIRDDGLRRVIITGFTVSWSVSIVSDAVFLDLGRSSMTVRNRSDRYAFRKFPCERILLNGSLTGSSKFRQDSTGNLLDFAGNSFFTSDWNPSARKWLLFVGTHRNRQKIRRIQSSY